MATSGQQDSGALEHAWAYFQLHAQQRITIFNYFVVFSGILATGLAAAIQAPPRLASVGVALGILLSVLSYIFWQIDKRTSFLVKHSEDAIKRHEPVGAQLVTEEVAKTDAAKAQGLWTYGKAFRVIFIIMGIVGLSGAAVSGLRWSGRLTWDEPNTTQQASPNQVQALPASAGQPTPAVYTPQAIPVNSQQPVGLSSPNARQTNSSVRSPLVVDR